MKKLLVILCMLVVLGCSKKNEEEVFNIEESKVKVSEPELAGTKRPKIVVFTSKGGNGHMSACNALTEALPDCDIKLVRPIHDFFKGFLDEEEWYGEFLKKGWIRSGNFIARYPGPTFMNMRSGTFKKRFVRFLEQEKPDLLISVIPLINYPAACAAKRCNIPFMLITLDADLELWLSNMKKCKDKNITVTVRSKTSHIQKQLKHSHILDNCVHEVGSPLRKDFFTPKNKEIIHKEWNIPEGKPVIMLLRGSTGSNKMLDYVNTLIKVDKPLHLLVCVGRNTAIVPKLERIKPSTPVTFSIVPFTPKIPDLMAISDLLITQPSPNVCNEAIHMRLPILVDMTSTCLFWEKPTIDWIKTDGFGDVFNKMSQLNDLVLKTLENHSKYVCQPQSARPNLSFNTEIRKIVLDKLNQHKVVDKG